MSSPKSPYKSIGINPQELLGLKSNIKRDIKKVSQSANTKKVLEQE
jgi:hypothetical protein